MILKKVLLVYCLLVVGTNSEVSETGRDKQAVSQEEKKSIKINNTLVDTFIDISSVPSVTQGEEEFKQMCMNTGGQEAYDRASTALKDIRKCFTSVAEYAKLPLDIMENKPHGNLDVVFNNYCKRTDELKGCVIKFLSEIDPCLPEENKGSKYTLQNITETVLNFVCENEGDHLALFVSEKGIECIREKHVGISGCLDKYLHNVTLKNDSSVSEGEENSDSFLTSQNATEEKPFSLHFELEQCKTAFQIRKCIINELTTCSGPTPANVVEAVFNLIQNSTTCAKYGRCDLDPECSSGVPLYHSIFSFIIPALTILMVRIFS